MSAPASGAPGPNLWRNRNFNVFWSGQALSALGDAFGFIALPLLIYQATGSVAQMGLVTGMFGAGDLVAGLFSGVLVDRLDRRRLMIVCDLGRAALYGLLPLAWWVSGPQLWLIYVVTAPAALLGNTFQVGYITAIPNLVERAQITEANGRMQSVLGVMFLVGPMLAGFISQTFGPVTAIGLDALSFLASVLSLLFIRLRPQAPAEPGAESRGAWTELLAGVRFLWRQPVLRAVAILIGGYVFLSNSVSDLLIYHIKHDLGGDDNAVGVVFGLASLGGVVAGLMAALLRRRWGFSLCWIASGIVMGLTLTAVGLVGSVAAIAVIGPLFSFAESLRGINSMSLRQEITPDHLLGRVTAAFWTLNTVPGPLGAALMTSLAATWGAASILMLVGVGGILLAAVALFTPIWRQRAALARVGG